MKCFFRVLLLLRPVDSTILFFQEYLVIVITLEHTRENRMRSICLQFSNPFLKAELIRFFSRAHKGRLRKISIERCVTWEAIKTKAQSL